MAREVRDLLVDFLSKFGCPDCGDEAILEYACGVLQSTIEDDGGEELHESLAHVDALLAGSCGERYEAHAEAMRLQQLATIVQEARIPNINSNSASKPTKGAVAQQQAPPPSSSRGVLANGSSSSSSSSSSSGGGSSGENIPPAANTPGHVTMPAVLGEIKVLCSRAVSEEFLAYALERKFQMDAEALASWLLDSDSAELQSAEAQWEEQRQREIAEEEAARLLKERNKQQILQKFDLRPVEQPKDTKKGGKGGPPVMMWTDKQQPQLRKVRYLDDRVVSTKGEKFIIEKMGEEWDGGSRGKVYTKGKRGKGFT